MRASSALLLFVLTGLAACGSVDSPTAARIPSGAPHRTIDDWGRWGTRNFYFLPGTPPPGTVENAFDATLSPTVRLCRLTGTVCGSTLATWTKTSGSYGRLVTVNTTGRSYNVTWPTASTGVASGQTYRVSVTVSGRVLGSLDVKVVSTSTQLAAVDTTQFRGVIAGGSFPVSFRINQGIVGAVTLSPASVSLNVADGTPLTAVVTDLHGQVITGELGYLFEDDTPGSGPVAVVDSGMVVGMRPGTSTLWAWYDDYMVTIPVTVTDTRRAWTVMPTPDTEQNRALWGSSATNVFAAGNGGMLRYDGTAWTQQTAVKWRSMNDVAGTSATDVWAVGDNGFILRFNGTAWSAVRFNGTSVSPYDLSTWSLPGQVVNLRAVFPVPGSSLVGIGGDNGTVLTYDGAAWTVYSLGDAAAVTSLWGTAYTNIYIARADGRLQHFDGVNYVTVAGVAAPGSMNAVWGSSATNVYAVGAAGTVYRYNGTTWSRIRLPTRADLYTVWGTSATNVFVGGSDGAVYRYNGTAWTPEKVVAPAETQNLGLWVASGGEAFLAGGGGMIAKR